MATKYSFDEEGITFYFFIMTIIGIYVVPTTLALVWPKRDGAGDREPSSSSAESTAKRSRQASARLSRASKALPKVALLGLLWSVFAWALVCAWNAKSKTKLYDPFEIMGIPTTSTEAAIRVAFKKLSRKYHPDKATDETRTLHETMFVEIGKAYKALTDEKVRKNWEEFGNPDGVRSFSLGVALPPWLVSSGNRVVVLAFYCAAFGLLLPLLVRRWWSMSRRYTKDGLRHSSMRLFFQELKENSSARKIVELVSAAAELTEDMPTRVSDAADLQALLALVEAHEDATGSVFDRPKGQEVTPEQMRASALVYAHLHRINMPSASFSEDKDYVAVTSLRLLQGIMQIAQARGWLNPVLTCMTLSQCFVQAVTEKDSELLQLPFVTGAIVKELSALRHPVRTIVDLVEMSEGDRRAALSALSDAQYSDVMAIAQTFPSVHVEAISFKTLGEDKITPGGLVTCQLRMTLEYPTVKGASSAESPVEAKKKASSAGGEGGEEDEVTTFEFDEDGNLLDDAPAAGGRQPAAGGAAQGARPVYCPRFGATKRPTWWVALVNKNNTNFVAGPIRVTDLVDTKKVVLQFAAPPRPITVPINLVVRGDCALGGGLTREVKFTVVPATAAVEEEWDISGDEREETVSFDE